MRNIIPAAAATSALLLLILVPLNVQAQGANANGPTGPIQSASDSSLTLVIGKIVDSRSWSRR